MCSFVYVGKLGPKETEIKKKTVDKNQNELEESGSIQGTYTDSTRHWFLYDSNNRQTDRQSDSKEEGKHKGHCVDIYSWLQDYLNLFDARTNTFKYCLYHCFILFNCVAVLVPVPACLPVLFFFIFYFFCHCLLLLVFSVGYKVFSFTLTFIYF